jgi:methionine synthase II (cobalamin-independent)
MFATVTGALPRRSHDGLDLDALADAVAAGAADPATLDAATEALVQDWLVEQVTAGLEPLTDGQVRTPDLAATVADALGLDAGSDARWTAPILVATWRAAAASADRAVKQAIPGPYTLARRDAPVGSPAEERATRSLAIADALAHEIAALATAGCPLVEVEEPAAVAIGTDEAERELFVETQRRLLRDAGTLHASLAVVGGDASAAGEATFVETPYASFLFDLIAGPDDWRLIARTPGQRGIVCGALDARAEATDDPALLVWAAHYAASTGGRGLARVGLSTSSSLRGLTHERAVAKLRVLGDAARIAGAGSVDAIAAALDPRAIDSRTAALGGVQPRPRPRVPPSPRS